MDSTWSTHKASKDNYCNLEKMDRDIVKCSKNILWNVSWGQKSIKLICQASNTMSTKVLFVYIKHSTAPFKIFNVTVLLQTWIFGWKHFVTGVSSLLWVLVFTFALKDVLVQECSSRVSIWKLHVKQFPRHPFYALLTLTGLSCWWIWSMFVKKNALTSRDTLLCWCWVPAPSLIRPAALLCPINPSLPVEIIAEDI